MKIKTVVITRGVFSGTLKDLFRYNTHGYALRNIYAHPVVFYGPRTRWPRI